MKGIFFAKTLHQLEFNTSQIKQWHCPRILPLDLLFAAANTWFSLFARICEYSANSANTSGAIWKRSFEGLIHRFYCIFGYNCIVLACKKQHMQLMWLTFEIIDYLEFQEWIQAQSKLTKRPKKVFLGVRIPANTWKCDIWYLVFARIPNSANTK